MITKHLIRSLALLLIFGLCNSVFAEQKKDVELLTPWGSEQGIIWLSESQHKTDFFKLANHFESQNNKIYCGLASSAIVLNALRVRNGNKQKPKADSVLSKNDTKYISKRFSPFFERYTQDNVFTQSAKSKLEVLGKPLRVFENKKPQRDIGLQLEQLKQLLESHDLAITKVVADKTTENKMSLTDFRQHLKSNLVSKDDYILVNYYRKTLGQKGGGHISPLGAYHEKSDQVLVMDVNSNKADWVWLSVVQLHKSMSTFDTIENRGYLLVSENN